MKGEWCYWQNVVSNEVCDEVIRKAMHLEVQNPTIGFDSTTADYTYRRCKIRWIDSTKNPEFNFIYDIMWKVMQKMNSDWFGFNVLSLPPMQFTEYDSSYLGEYRSHQDVFWISPTHTHRKISLVLQLSNPHEYEGGDLTFEKITHQPTESDMLCMKTKGTIIGFPSFVYHQLNPVTRGKRYSLVAWFEGPKFQ